MNEQEKQRVHELLCAYVFGELEGAERTEIETELAKSPELRAEREKLEATIGLVQNAMGEEPEGLSTSAMGSVLAAAGRSATPSASKGRPWYSTTAFRLAASLAVVGSVGFVLVRSYAPEEQAPFTYHVFGDGRPSKNRVARREEGDQQAQAAKPSERQLDEMKGLGYPGNDSLSGSSSGSKSEGTEIQASIDAPAEGLFEEAESERRDRDLLQALGYSGGEADDGSTAKSRQDNGARSQSGPAAAAPGSPAAAAPNATVTFQSPPQLGGSRAGGGAASPSARPVPQRSNVAPSEKAVLLEKIRALGYYGGGSPSNQRESTATGDSSWFLGRGMKKDSPADLAKERGPSLGGLLASNATLNELYLKGYLDTEDLTAMLDGNLADESLRDLGYAGNDSPLYRADPDLLCRQILESCRRRPQERPRAMFFRYWGDNPFQWTALDALSTFSVDVDTASYALARRYLAGGHVPEKAQVRTEEFVNSFDSGVEPPVEETFAIDLEAAPSLFGSDERERWMMRVVVRGKEVADFERQPMALTFVVDNSGSMSSENRLELVKHSLRLLVAQLDGNDAIALVSFNNESRLVLPMTSVANRATIETAIDAMRPNGGTNAEAGLKLGYAHAYDAFTEGSTNRVIFLSDGVANIGQTDQDRLNDEVAAFRKKGIYLNTIGVGMGNHNDTFLEQLANKGDGICDYIDTPRQAQKALVENFTGALVPIARDVKIQVEFDPNQVSSYRLLGYENRAIADRDFRNDAVDAGEVGAGHQVTALYELEPASSVSSELPLATVRVRYKQPHGEGAKEEAEVASEIERSMPVSELSSDYRATSVGYRRAVLVAQFAEFLRRSVHARGDSFDRLLAEAQALAPESPDPDFTELVQLLERSRELIVNSLPRHDALSQAIDAVRKNYFLRAQIEDLPDPKPELLQQIEQQNQDLEERLRQLLEQELGAGD